MITYLLALYENEKNYEGKAEADMAKVIGEHEAFTEGIRKSGNYIGGEALQPVATATTVRVRDGKRLTTDGPFAETKEQLGGFFVIDVPDLDTALAWAARSPAASYGTAEVRPLLPPMNG
jgi:hypothetical protein